MVGFIFGLTAYLNGDHLNGKTLSLVLVFSFFGGVGGALRERPLKPITLVEAMSWEWSQFMARVILGLIIGAIAGLILALIFVLATFIAREPLYNALIGLGIGLTFGLIGGVIWGLFAGFRHRAKMGKSSPNQGIKLSLKNSLTAFLITCLTVWLITWLPFALILRWHFSPLEAGLGWPLILGLIIGFNQGGSSVIKHYALRLILWLSGRMPLNYVKSLDHCAKLIFLKKVGGGYIFIHRMLLDYFADLPPPQRLVRAPPLSRSRKLPGG
jgi:hypothetical protein